ncbi:MAG: histidine phosphatase family protein, partial [Gammaproteobacteria bacterium]|nr:histidine phosphatase family protein [Gammaproteobacteria bacterium]
MKTLTLVRHAKSSWKDSGLSDRERPLNKRGERDAPVMGKRAAAAGLRPSQIISSPAVRAWTTAKI